MRPLYGTWDKKLEKLNIKARENSIILMCDEYKITVTAVLKVIVELREQGHGA